MPFQEIAPASQFEAQRTASFQLTKNLTLQVLHFFKGIFSAPQRGQRFVQLNHLNHL